MTDIPALIERLRRHCYCGSLKWAYEDRESDVCDIHCAAAALAEQGKALAAARVAEGEAMLVVEQQDREIERLTRQRDLAARAIHDDIDYENEVEVEAAALRRQLAEARAEVKRLAKGHDEYNRANRLMADAIERLEGQLAEAREVLQDIKNHGGGDDAYLYCRIRARQWLASTEKQ